MRRAAPGRLDGEGLALREVAAVDADASHAEVGQRSAAALVQPAVDCTSTLAHETSGRPASSMATDPDTPGRELRLRAEAISPTLAEHARRKLQDRIGLS